MDLYQVVTDKILAQLESGEFGSLDHTQISDAPIWREAVTALRAAEITS